MWTSVMFWTSGLRSGFLRELLDANGDALVFAVDLQHLRLDIQPLLLHLGRVVDLASPGDVGDVDHGVESLLQTHESTGNIGAFTPTQTWEMTEI